MTRKLLEKAYELLGVALSYDEDVFGVHHNDVIDTINAIEVELKEQEHNEWAPYLREGQTPFERFIQERNDLDALITLYRRELEKQLQKKTS